MLAQDDGLTQFAAHGLALPSGGTAGTTEHDGARIWHASYGNGTPVILLHGGLGHSGNFSNQIPALTAAGYWAIAIDSRGHGRSTRDARASSYELMAADVVAVMDALGVDRAAFVGWSDGACVAMELARHVPERVAGVFFFACNMDPSGTKEIDESDPLLGRCFGRHAADYKALSTTPDGFQTLVSDVSAMQRTQPNWSAADLATVTVPVAVVLGEHDEFIKRGHVEYLARSIPGATLAILPDVSHFAPLQRPGVFNAAVLEFLEKTG